MKLKNLMLVTVACQLAACFHPLFSGPDTSGTLGAQGGTVRSSDGTVELVVPPGALAGPVNITLAQSAASPLPTGSKALGPPWVLGPAGTTFSVPAQLTINFPAGQVPQGSTPVIFEAPAGQVAAQPLPSSVGGSGTVVAPIDGAGEVEAAIIVLQMSTAGSGGSTGCRLGTIGAAGGSGGPPTCQLAWANCDGSQMWNVSCSGTTCQCLVNGRAVATVQIQDVAECSEAFAPCNFPAGTGATSTSGSTGSSSSSSHPATTASAAVGATSSASLASSTGASALSTSSAADVGTGSTGMTSTGPGSSETATTGTGSSGTGSARCTVLSDSASGGGTGSPPTCVLDRNRCNGNEAWTVSCIGATCTCYVDGVAQATVPIADAAKCDEAWEPCNFTGGSTGAVSTSSTSTIAAGAATGSGTTGTGNTGGGTFSGSGTTGAVCGVDVLCPTHEACLLSSTPCTGQPSVSSQNGPGVCVPEVYCSGSGGCAGKPCTQDDDCDAESTCVGGACKSLGCSGSSTVCKNGCLKYAAPHTCQTECICDYCPGADAGEGTGACSMSSPCPPGQYCVLNATVCPTTDYATSPGGPSNGLDGVGVCQPYRVCAKNDCSGLACSTDADCSEDQFCRGQTCAYALCGSQFTCEEGCSVVTGFHTCEKTCICGSCEP